MYNLDLLGLIPRPHSHIIIIMDAERQAYAEKIGDQSRGMNPETLGS